MACKLCSGCRLAMFEEAKYSLLGARRYVRDGGRTQTMLAETSWVDPLRRILVGGRHTIGIDPRITRSKSGREVKKLVP